MPCQDLELCPRLGVRGAFETGLKRTEGPIGSMTKSNIFDRSHYAVKTRPTRQSCNIFALSKLDPRLP